LFACVPPPPAAAVEAAAAVAASAARPVVGMVTPSRLLPAIGLRPHATSIPVGRSRARLSDFKRDPVAWGHEWGRTLYLVDGLRIVQHGDSHVERADERFPAGATRALSLPPRLGGGYLFWQVSARGTHLWRAPRWEARLAPVASILARAQQIIAGFDRLYLRSKRGGVIALDVEDRKSVV
jgi:hypothetical protein